MSGSTISSYTTTHNCIEMEYPFRECIGSLLGFSDDVVIVDAGSTDGTIEALQAIAAREPRVRVFVEPVDFSHPRWAVQMDGNLKRKARARCLGDYCWQTDTDEIVVARDFSRIRELPILFADYWERYPVVFLPMVEFWGSLDFIRADFLSWKPRFSRNLPDIVHGIPLEFRMVDPAGNEYPRPFDSDSCNYMYASNDTSVPALFPKKIARVDMEAAEFDHFIHESIEQLPSVLHISWLDLGRKMRHYRKLWSAFHTSMYNLGDAENRNDWFPKPWKQVTDTDIDQMAAELLAKGPRMHYQKSHGAMVPFRGPIPDELRRWVATTLTPGTHRSTTVGAHQ